MKIEYNSDITTNETKDFTGNVISQIGTDHLVVKNYSVNN